jgi:hypothetical protein
MPKDLWTLTVQRGCRHYWQGDEPEGELVSETTLTNEELAIALLNCAGSYSPHSIRCGAAMLGAFGNDPAIVARLAIWERSEAVVRFVAECGRKYEPQNVFWRDVLDRLPECSVLKDGVMPHPTRFVAMSGYERGVGKKNHNCVAAPSAECGMTNAEIIATTLDVSSDHEVSLIMNGRAAFGIFSATSA